MFDRLSRSWELVKASWSVLQQDKELLVFPLISSVAMLAVVDRPVFGSNFSARLVSWDASAPALTESSNPSSNRLFG